MSETKIKKLKGKDLLNQVKELSDKSRRERAKKCGYYTITKNQEERVNLTEFYDAVLEAKGVPLDPDTKTDGRGREATYRVSVHKNGQIVIGSTYTKAMGLKPGDEFEIKLGYKHIQLKNLSEKAISDSSDDNNQDNNQDDNNESSSE